MALEWYRSVKSCSTRTTSVWVNGLRGVWVSQNLYFPRTEIVVRFELNANSCFWHRPDVCPKHVKLNARLDYLASEGATKLTGGSFRNRFDIVGATVGDRNVFHTIFVMTQESCKSTLCIRSITKKIPRKKYGWNEIEIANPKKSKSREKTEREQILWHRSKTEQEWKRTQTDLLRTSATFVYWNPLRPNEVFRVYVYLPLHTCICGRISVFGFLMSDSGDNPKFLFMAKCRTYHVHAHTHNINLLLHRFFYVKIQMQTNALE